jgi:hypothetical protein
MADGSRHVVAPAALAHASRGAESRSGSPAIPRLRRSSALSEGPRNGAKIVSRKAIFVFDRLERGAITRPLLGRRTAVR